MYLLRLTGAALICASILIFASAPCRCEVDFDRLHGSDLAMGIGARAVAMAGAFVAVADDASALFWNPAGLTRLGGSQLFLSVDLPANLSSMAVVYKPGNEKLRGIDFTIGLGWIDRLSFKGDSGSDQWEGYPANLLDMAMIDIDEDFSGRISSNTRDLRLSAAMTPKYLQNISLGINLAYIS